MCERIRDEQNLGRAELELCSRVCVCVCLSGWLSAFLPARLPAGLRVCPPACLPACVCVPLSLVVQCRASDVEVR